MHRATGPTDYRGRGLQEGGTVHILNEAGDIINPASQEDVVVATSHLSEGVQDLTSVAMAQGDSIQTMLLPRPRRFNSTKGAEGSLTTTYAALSVAIPTHAKHLGVITLWLEDVTTGTEVMWSLSADAAGNRPITAVQTDTIIGQTAGAGGVARLLEFPVEVLNGTLYAWVKVDAGTARGTIGVTWEE